jgi:hypothetical protein
MLGFARTEYGQYEGVNTKGSIRREARGMYCVESSGLLGGEFG